MRRSRFRVKRPGRLTQNAPGGVVHRAAGETVTETAIVEREQLVN